MPNDGDTMSNPSGAKGAYFERSVVDYLRSVGYPAALRTRTPGQAADRGDIAGLPLTLELKNQKILCLPAWWTQVCKAAEKTKLPPVLIHKRKGVTDPAKQWVTMDVQTFLKLFKDGDN